MKGKIEKASRDIQVEKSLPRNHLQFGKGQARYQGHQIGELSDWMENHGYWSSFRMSRIIYMYMIDADGIRALVIGLGQISSFVSLSYIHYNRLTFCTLRRAISILSASSLRDSVS